MPRAAAGISKRTAKSKQVQVVATVSSDGNIQGSFSPEPKRPLIAHLPFRSADVQFTDGPLVYDPRPPGIPQPYDAIADDLYASAAEPLATFDDTNTSGQNELPPPISESAIHTTDAGKTQAPAVPVDDKPIKAFRTIDVMLDYKHANESRSLPESTSAACFWCAGCFEGRPVVLPTQEESGTYTVYGNFCTLACGLSYLLNELIDPQVRWERQALFHRMYKQTNSVQPAPPREALRFFGGSLSHEQYRNVVGQKQIRIDSHLPPVISILSTLDTKPIDFYETSFRNTTTAAPGESSAGVTQETGLRLKRTKPLKDKANTLDAVMNLQVKVKG